MAKAPERKQRRDVEARILRAQTPQAKSDAKLSAVEAFRRAVGQRTWRLG